MHACTMYGNPPGVNWILDGHEYTGKVLKSGVSLYNPLFQNESNRQVIPWHHFVGGAAMW